MAEDTKSAKAERPATPAIPTAPATVRLRCIVDRCFAENDKSYPEGEEFDATPAVAEAMLKLKQAEKA